MSNDRLLKESVLAQLSWEPTVNAAHIGVTAHDGVVTLSGQVDTYAEKYAAQSAALRVSGVKGLAEEIQVKLLFGMKRNDEEIAKAALEHLSWDVTLPKDAIKVQVQNGHVTLTGQVDWHHQQDTAEKDIRNMWGIVDISNETTIKPVVNTANISDAIKVALGRSWFFNPKTVDVSADGGRVQLNGNVSSWHDRQIATDMAWFAPGVTAVENDLVVI